MSDEPATLTRIPLPGASLRFAPGWLARESADALFAELHATIPWEVHRIRLFGRSVDTPRRSCWIGDPSAIYVYSGTRFEAHPWPPALAALRTAVQDACGTPFDSVLANLYRDGRDRMGWHSDDEPELGPRPVIASISLGATRRFLLKHRTDPSQRLALELPHGSLLVMAGETQRLYRHALPASTRVTAARINLTFRHIVGIDR